MTEVLECGFCLNYFSEPVKLPCSHVLCKGCVTVLTQFSLLNETTKLSEDVVKCPSCNQHNIVDLHKLTIDVKIVGLVSQKLKGPLCSNKCGNPASIECTTCGPLCAQCNTTIHILNVFSTHVRVALGENSKSIMCSEHATKEAEVFCRECSQPVCLACSQYSTHKDHTCVLIDKYTTQCKREVEQRVHHLNNKMQELKQFSSQIDSIIGKVNAEHDKYESNLTMVVNNIRDLLETKYSELIVKSRSIKQQKLEKLTRQKDILSTVVNQSVSHVGSCSNKLQDDTDGTYINMRSKLDGLLSIYNGLELDPHALDGIIVNTTDNGLVHELNTFSFITDMVVPARPAPPISERKGNKIVVSWTPPETTADIICYSLYMSNLTQKRPYEAVYSGMQTTFVVPEAKISCQYGFKVSAWTSHGEGRLSKEGVTNTVFKVVKSFEFKYPYDKNGILYWIGTGGDHIQGTYSNPLVTNQIVATPSSVHSQSDNITLLGDWTLLDGMFHTNDELNSWIAFDFQKYRIVPSYYTLRTDSSEKYTLRNWSFQASVDGNRWLTIKQHDNDRSLQDSKFSSASWKLDGGQKAYRYFRILQTGKNQSGLETGVFSSLFTTKTVTGANILSLGGFEIYGTLIEEHETPKTI